jgi:hypothetical protein
LGFADFPKNGFKLASDKKISGVDADEVGSRLQLLISTSLHASFSSRLIRLLLISMDESFACLAGVPRDFEVLGRLIRAQVYRYTGIPVDVGIARTKNLIKLSTHTAKRWQAQSGNGWPS